MRQALLLGLSFNLYRLRHRYLFLRMSIKLIKIKTSSLLALGQWNVKGWWTFPSE